MINQIHSRGTGGGSGPVQYLLGRDGQREGSRLLRGDPEQTAALIDSSKYAKKYTSGVLSFAEADLPEEAKQQIMSSFELALLPGLDQGQYDCLWVEHTDKGRLELNYVVPNLELTSGKRLQPYYDKADRPRLNAWKDVINAHFKLHDPNDPANRQLLTPPKDLPRSSLEAQRAITDGLLEMASQGLVKDREGVLRALQEGGFTVAREGKGFISIENPHGNRNIRLKGALYERTFNVSEDLRADIEAASERYQSSVEDRVREARSVYKRGTEIKRAENQRRYPRAEPAIEGPRPQGLGVSGAERRHVVDRGIRGPLVDRGPDRSERADHQQADRDDQAAEHRRGLHPMERMWGPSLRENRQERPRIRERVQDSGRGLDDDRARAAAIGRIRSVTRRLREAASGIAADVREFARDVYHNAEGQRRAEESRRKLDEAARQLEQAARKVIQQENTREEVKPPVARSRGPSMGP